VISQYQGRHTQKRTSLRVARAPKATFLGLHTRESCSVAHAALANAPFDPQQARAPQNGPRAMTLIKTQMALEN
jgi:hypothetical protein